MILSSQRGQDKRKKKTKKKKYLEEEEEGEFWRGRLPCFKLWTLGQQDCRSIDAENLVVNM